MHIITKSRLNKGHLRIPSLLNDNNHQRKTPKSTTNSSKKSTTQNTTKHRVLVVEDNLINQKVAKLFLESLSYEADIAANGQQALAMFHRGYSLILMDLGLPDLDGVEITKKIREQNKHVPIIACTASGESYKTNCFDAGMDDFIVKPMMLEELKQVLAKFLATKETH